MYEDGDLGIQAAGAAGMQVIDVRPWYNPSSPATMRAMIPIVQISSIRQFFLQSKPALLCLRELIRHRFKLRM